MRHPTGVQIGQQVDWKKVRVLVFGLDDQFRFLARQTFRKLAVRDVESFSEPGDAPTLLARGVDIVLVDLADNPNGGLAVIERLRGGADNPYDDVPVLVVVPPARKEAAERARALGIEGVVPKPISGHELTHRVAEALTNPVRLPKPVVDTPKPKPNYIKTPEPLPDLGPVVPASGNPPRPGREGPWSELSVITTAPAGATRPPVPPTATPVPPPVPLVAKPAAAPAAQTRPAAAPAIAAKPVPAGVARPVNAATGSASTRPSSAGFETAGSGVARKVTGGLLDEADLVALPAKRGGVGIEVAGLKPDLDAEAARRQAEKRRQKWAEEMERIGHKPRKGGDVAAMDFSAVVAEHGKWLASKGAEGTRATFSGMDLAGADFAGAILANATFREVDLSDACLSDARLDGSDFRYATLSAANLGGANLGVAALRHAKLELSNLEGASLRGADLSGASLCGSRTAGADFKGAILMGADLREADLSQVEGLTTAQLEKSICDMGTRLPPGVFRPRKDGE